MCVYSVAQSCPWDFSGKNTEIGQRFLLQGIFLTQGSSPPLLHWQMDSSPMSHRESPWYYYYTQKNLLFFVLVTVTCAIFQDIKILNGLIFWHPKRLLLSFRRAGYWINPLPSRKWFSFQRERACDDNSHASWIFWSTQILRVNLISKQRISPMNLISGSLWPLCVVWRGVWFSLVTDLPGLWPGDQEPGNCESVAGQNQRFDCFSVGFPWILTCDCLISKFSKRKCQRFFCIIHGNYLWVKIKEQHICIHIFMFLLIQ